MKKAYKFMVPININILWQVKLWCTLAALFHDTGIVCSIFRKKISTETVFEYFKQLLKEKREILVTSGKADGRQKLQTKTRDSHPKQGSWHVWICLQKKKKRTMFSTQWFKIFKVGYWKWMQVKCWQVYIYVQPILK